jgi:transcriptional activator of cad operon
MFRIGEWCVNPASGQITRMGETARLEERAMRLLVCLADRAGEVVSIEDLLSQVWPDVTVTPDSVYQAVASLRRQLGDDPKQPIYIATIPRLGYRMVATVAPLPDPAAPDTRSGPPSVTTALPARQAFLWLSVAAICVATVLVFIVFRHRLIGTPAKAVAAYPERSLAVLPFIDLTAGMKEEEFADGLTEELIDKISKIPGVRVPAPTASFYFKYKQIPVAEIARSLGVAYILDGSTRQSGTTVRIAARLLRPDNGYVMWSETYDRPFTDRVAVQDAIAAEITRKLEDSLENAPTAIPR